MSDASICIGVFAASLAFDLLPFVGPPAWMAMVFFLTKYDLSPWLVLAAGVPGSVLGRYLLSRYIPKVSDNAMKKRKSDELKYVGGKLRQKTWQSWLFVLLYSCLPMSTTALFIAAGIARISPWLVIPPFTLGKFASDAMMVIGGSYVAVNLHDLGESLLSFKGIVGGATGLAILFALFFLDWRILCNGTHSPSTSASGSEEGGALASPVFARKKNHRRIVVRFREPEGLFGLDSFEHVIRL